MARIVTRKGLILPLIFLFSLLPARPTASAGGAVSVTPVRVLSPISSPYYPVVLKGEGLPSLVGVPVGRIAFYAVLDQGLQPIPFQIDRRDRKGNFQIPAGPREEEAEARSPLDGNDECVFMAGDAGERIKVSPRIPGRVAMTEIEVRDPEDGADAWVYALVFDTAAPPAPVEDYVSYDRERDAVESDTYRIAFSKKKPFLMDTLIQKEAGAARTSEDFVDTMKVRHRGKFLHRFDFLRTQQDYTSRLTAVKDGPVRVIRRTENRVRVLWRLKTPVIRIDYLHYRNAMFMDTLIDLPFKPGWFFSDMETLMTVDGNDDPSLPAATLYTRSFPGGLAIDGGMTEEKTKLNASRDQDFALSSLYGKILVRLDIPKGSPIGGHVYLMDDRNTPDPPEEVPGQFGDVGFLTTGWDKLDSASHHLAVMVYLIRDVSLEQGFRILKNSPSLAN